MSRIITFYSYKGGVGRTFALANIGVLLAREGKKVLLMDWDLEAPGLDRYFFKRPTDELRPECGMIHLLHEAAKNPEADWRKHVIPAKVINIPSLFLLPSGAAHEEYAHGVRSFSWPNFFSQQEGAAILERWREEWLAEYDFILIDSRTGLTDVSGVCTVLLPDFLVLVFSANEQSFPNAISVALSAQKSRKELNVQRPPLMILPLPSRFDGRDETEDAKIWLRRFAEKLKPFYDDWLPASYQPSQIIALTKIPYLTKCSFGEPLTVIDLGTEEPDWPGFYLEKAARLLRSDFADAVQIIAPSAKPALSLAEKFKAEIEQAGSNESVIQTILKNAEDQLGQTVEFVNLLDAAAQLLFKFAQFSAAELLWHRARAIVETTLGRDDLIAGQIINNLAQSLFATNRMAEAEPLMRQALVISEKNCGQIHPAFAAALNNLASLLRATNRPDEAEPLFRRALEIYEKNPGKDHPSVASALNNLAGLLRDTNRPDEAEPLIRRALEISEKSLGKDHPSVASALNNLAGLLEATNRFAEAELFFRRAIEIGERSLGKDHPKVATWSNNLASLLQNTNRLAEAELLFRRALEIEEKSYGKYHPEVSIVLNNLAGLMQSTNRLAEAEALFCRALEIGEKSLGKDHTDVGIRLNNLAGLLRETNRLDEAKPLSRRHLKIFLKFTLRTGQNHPHLEDASHNYKRLLNEMGWERERIEGELKKVREEAEQEVARR